MALLTSSYKIRAELFTQLKDFAEQQGIPKNRIVGLAIEEYLRNAQSKNPLEAA
ncbi:MAG TPA: hypothetical protein V6D19_06540 [Stenomitos sp.]